MKSRLPTIAKGVWFGCLSLVGWCLQASLAPDRYGAVYGPGETACFTCEADERWTAYDCSDRVMAQGVVTNGRLAVSHGLLSERFGSFRLEVGTNETWFAYLPSKEVKPCAWVGTGTHASHGWESGDLRLVDLIAHAGIGIVRDEPCWAKCEKRRGEYAVPQAYENYVNALLARGIKTDMLLSYGNGIYENPLDDAAFAAWAEWMARHFDGRVDTFEIWNEPHNFHFYRRYGGKGPGDVSAPWLRKFVDFTHRASDAIRKVQPRARVLVAAEDYEHHLYRLLQLGIARRHEVISFHPYGHQKIRPEEALFLSDGGSFIHRMALENGGSRRFAITECGWTTVAPTGKVEHAWVGNYPRSSYLEQAQYLVRMYLLARQQGVEFVCQYDLRDDGPKRHYTEHNFGLLNFDGSPKPAYAAVAAMTRIVGESAPCGDLSTAPGLYRLYRFEKDEVGVQKSEVGDEVLVGWSVCGSEAIVLPKECRGAEVRVYDLFGNEKAKAVSDGQVVLTECPVYMVVSRK